MEGEEERNPDICECGGCVLGSTSEDAEDACFEENRFIDRNRSSTLLSGISSMYRDKLFVDLTLVAADLEFGCHRNVLAISSPFFAAMFESNMAEKSQTKIEIKEMDPNTLSLVLDYIYCGEVELSIGNVQNVLSAANLFQVLPLRDGCAAFMLQHISVANCIGIYFFAKAHECHRLAARAHLIVKTEFEEVSRELEFRALLTEEQLIEVISDDQINVHNEELLYEACLSWLEYSPSERKASLPSVMRCIRFANMSPFYFCDVVEKNAELCECRELRDLWASVRAYHMMHNRHLEFDVNNVPRTGMAYERVIFILANPYTDDDAKKFNSVEILMPRTGEIRYLCKLPQGLFMPGVCVTGDNQIYLAGGEFRKYRHLRHENSRVPIVQEAVSSNVFALNVGSQMWDVKNNMNQQRSLFPLVVVDGSLYAVGGRDGSRLLNCVERYDLQFGTWTTVAPLPQPLCCTTALSYRGKLYVFGGESATDIVNTAFRYEPVTNTWTALPPMQHARALACSVVYRNKVYVMGGNSVITPKWKKEFMPENCVITVEVFDPSTNTWSLGPNLANALCGAAVVKHGEDILLVGGEDDKSWMAGMYSLREEKGVQSWVAGLELAHVMSTFGCVIANIQKELIVELD